MSTDGFPQVLPDFKVLEHLFCLLQYSDDNHIRADGNEPIVSDVDRKAHFNEIFIVQNS